VATGHGVTRTSRLDQVLAAGIARMRLAPVPTSVGNDNRGMLGMQQGHSEQRVRDRFAKHSPSKAPDEDELAGYPNYDLAVDLAMAEMSPSQEREVIRNVERDLLRGATPPVDPELRNQWEREWRELKDNLAGRVSPRSMRDVNNAFNDAKNAQLQAQSAYNRAMAEDAESGLFEAESEFNRTLRAQQELDALERVIPDAEELSDLPSADVPFLRPRTQGKSVRGPILGKPDTSMVPSDSDSEGEGPPQRVLAGPASPRSESDSEDEVAPQPVPAQMRVINPPVAAPSQGGARKARVPKGQRRPDAPINDVQRAALRDWLLENMYKPLTKAELGREYDQLLHQYGFADRQQIINQAKAMAQSISPGYERTFKTGGKHADGLTDAQKAAAYAFYEMSGQTKGDAALRAKAAQDVGLTDSKGRENFTRFIYALERADKARRANLTKRANRPPPKRPARSSNVVNMAPAPDRAEYLQNWLAQNPGPGPSYVPAPPPTYVPMPAPAVAREPSARGLPEAEQYEFVDPNAPYDPNMPVAPVVGQELVGDNPEMLTVIGRG